MSCRSRSDQKHTAAVSLATVTIHYPWHPLYEQTLPVRRQQVLGTDQRFIHVLLPDDTWCLVPAWMTSRERCAPLTLSERGEVSVAALREFARTLSELAKASHAVTIGSSTSAKGKEERGDEEAVGRTSVDVTRRQRPAVGRTAGGNTAQSAGGSGRAPTRRRRADQKKRRH